MRYRPRRFPGSLLTQPQCAVQADMERFPDLRHVFWPRTLGDVVSGRALANSGSVSAKLAVAPGGVCFDASGSSTQTFSLFTTVPPAVGWTLEALVSFTSFTSGQFVRHDASASVSGTFDRALELNGSKARSYVWDGGFKACEHPATLVADRVYHIIGTCSASQLRCYVDGDPSSPLTIANSGYNYGTNVWLLAGINPVAQIAMVAMWGRPLSHDEVSQRVSAPYSILRPA